MISQKEKKEIDKMTKEQATGKYNKLYTQIKTVNPSMVFTLDILEDSVSDIINLPEFKNIRKIDLPLDFSVPGHFAEKMKIRMLCFI